MSIATKLHDVRDSLPMGVQLVAVSKTHPEEHLLEAYNAGQRVFGENKVQELVRKYEQLPNDIEWHFIGHLQTNKVKYLAPFVHLIHGVDSLKLLKAIDKEGAKYERCINCLLQMKIAEEESKFGLSEEELRNVLGSEGYRTMKNIRVCGLMGMATFSDDEQKVQQEFKKLSTTFNVIREEFFAGDTSFKELSMGMSHDYLLAVKEGSTMVRVGSSIFGERNYQNK